MGVRCFLLEPINRYRVHLRRYKGSETKCTGPHGYHNAMVFIGDFDGELPSTDIICGHPGEPVTRSDLRWPAHCACGYEFQSKDNWQYFTDRLYQCTTTRQIHTLRDAPPGAMWYADWMGESWRGPDGHCLVVKTPAGEWMIDARASNCTMPDDNVHKCWCRHGTPPNITVNKQGNTCGAGGGSILKDSYHAMLENGELRPC